MRTAAGLIMLIGGILIGIPLTMYFAASSLWGLLAIPWAGVVVAGGIYTLQGKHWKLCLAASILTAGIVPVIFVALRRSEWEMKTMPFCSKCGSEVRENVKFCTKCGQKLMKSTQKTQPRSANKLFNYANERWHQRQRFLLDGDEGQAQKACVEVIRLCQLSLEANQRIGDAYVMLANALSVAASSVPRTLDMERYEFLLSRAAAAIHWWYSLPHRGYPTTKNTAIGEQLWRGIFDEVKEHNALTEDDALVLMGSYRDSLAADTISTSSFEQIEKVISNQSLTMPSLITPLAAESTPGSEVYKAETLEEICQLEGMVGIFVRRREGCLSWAEANIIWRKVSPLHRYPLTLKVKAFPVREEANEEEISQWLNHPLINAPLPDEILMDVAAQTPIPVATMERMLRKWLQEDYDRYYRMAAAKLKSKW